MVTDINGNFLINGVTEGEYYILAKLAGYISSPSSSTGESTMGTSLSDHTPKPAFARVRVEAGKTVVSNLSLNRGGSLSGTVYYDDGGLAINLPISLFQKSATGKLTPYNTEEDPSLAPLGLTSHTDDRGRFYESALPPGTYIVKVTLPISEITAQGITGPSSVEATLTEGNALSVFYGNKYQLAEASELALGEGEQRDGIDITIPTNGLHFVRGFVATGIDGRKVVQGTVRLLDPSTQTTLRQVDLHNDGSFEFKYVAGGTYIIEVNGQGQSSSGHPSSFKPFSATLVVETDISDLTYNISPVN